MIKFAFSSTLLMLLYGTVMSQNESIPAWFFKDLEIHEGKWITDNTSYESKDEPFDAFGMEWKKSALQVSMTGRLFAMKDGKDLGTIWEYREYWDPIEQEVIVLQFGPNGMFGKGTLKHLGDGHFESVQTFAAPDGQTSMAKHKNIIMDGTMSSTSFTQNEKGEWVKDRDYIWTKQ